MTVVVSLAACGGDSSRIDNDNEGSGSDPISPETDTSYVINVELRDLGTDELIVSPNPEEPVRIQVTVKLGNGDPVASDNITVTTTLGELTPNSGVVMTNDSGVASLMLDVEGQGVGSAGEIIVAYDSISTDQEPYSPLRFTIEEPSLQLGYLDTNKQFVPGGLEIPAQDLSSKGSMPISVYVQGPDGNPYTKRMQVVFSSNCSLSQPAVASLDSPVTTTEGKATSTYTAQGCEGEDSITAVLTAYSSISANGQLTVMPPEVGSIEFVSAEPEVIHIQGSGGKGTSEVRFQVFSKDDLPMSGVEVNFSLEEGEGNVTLVDSSGATDAEGQVSAFVNSGSVALPVSVKASITDSNGTSFSAFSRGLVVSAAILDQESFSLSASSKNPGGDSVDGVTSTITIRIGTPDNTIPDGTVISFKTEYGRIAGYCTTVDGNCSVDWNSQNPRAPIDYEFLGDDGLMHSLRTIFNTTCPVTGLRGDYPCPQPLGQPYGGRSTILAYALGQETFTDANGNGEFDTGETFIDLPEAFIDHNEDGAFGNSKSDGACYPDCPEEGGDEELFIPLNDNEKYDRGNDIYNGLSCSKAAEDEGACSKELVHVRGEIVILVAGSEPFGIFSTAEGGYSSEPEVKTSLGGTGNLYFYLSDVYNGRLPQGTTVKTKSENCEVTPESTVIGNSNVIGPDRIAFSINAPNDADIGSEYVKVEVNVPALEGSSDTGITKIWQFKCTVN
ncbi:Ig-like domain-containing protein [Microbulbifer sp. GL-2]|uniref:Ig-like domain-containing protein n=1 Tax=Microbulbifer sp. GL-2 TaxID=2591606 RepID=UPI00117F0068|nr:Ig-like domain-containing protein [Microbulbifer sp. GL-2]